MILMCNKEIACLSESESPIDQQQPHQAVYLMESPSTTPHFGSNSTHGTSSPVLNDENPRVKFLCSFSGSILPRPQDGKLRYVGGETRIVSVPRDIKYEELMSKMRELYKGAAVLKYQQPDEDLDALVSVVNDDDVTNMMEEYDKLGSGDGFTRLRIFLFSYPDQDGGSSHYDGDERDHERRYVDALNNLNDGSDFRKQHTESPVISSVDDLHVAEQFFSPMSLEGGLHSQRNEIPMPQYNLHRLKIPHVGSGQQHHQPISQRYNEMEAPWSPAYYSPRHHGHLDPRPMPEFPSSPSSALYRMPFSDVPDKCSDRMPEEFARPPLHHQPGYEHQPQYSDNVVWLPSGAISGEKSGFPGNIFHGNNVLEGNSSVCEHCRVCFQRNQPHLEQPNMVNGFHQVANLCADCPPNRETFMLNPDAKLHPGYATEQNNNSSTLYNENHNQWVPHHLNCRAEEARSHVSGTGKLNDHYIVDGPGMNLPLVHNNMVDVHHVSNNFVHQRAGPEMGNEAFHDRPVAGPPHVHIPPAEDRGVRYGNLPYACGGDNLYPVSHGHALGHAAWRNVQSTMHGVPPYDASNLAPQVNGSVNPGYPRHEGSPSLCIAVDNQNFWVESSQKVVGFDGKTVPDYSYGQALNLNPNTLAHENHHHQLSPELIQPTPDMLSSATPVDAVTRVMMLDTESLTQEQKEVNDVEKVENSDIQVMNQNNSGDKNCEVVPLESTYSNCPKLAEETGNAVKTSDNDQTTPEISKLSVNNLSFVPEMMASVKKAVIDGAEEAKAKVRPSTDPLKSNAIAKEAATNSLEPVNTPGDGEVDSDSENVNISKIEPTKAEAEAISKGLQTIKNDDLEEIRELGSGTYGAVFHGKWKGSDVAIKRIKASCFAGRPSERERLIADFWKEALILSSLHHPNVVSFYGIVRDGPDGSLATVTEFMVNGSLKQFLQKKDRTIDRRKRLIIAMDAAFGMEYLHGKNIVHFDLKCENLLVNMRDPQRPVCKIGDLGLSKVKQQTLVSGGVRGTLPWMAPELLSGKSNMVTEKIDVYSFGIVMWELLTGNEPYTDMHCASIIGGIVNNTLRPQIPTWCDPEWKSLMESCWGSEPAQRPSFSEISQKLRNMAAGMNVK